MSENLDLVRSIYADWERGDFSATGWAHPDIEYVNVDGPSPGRWTGLAGLTEGASTWINAWEGFRIEAEDFRELDDERILVLSKGSGRGRASGLDLGQLTRNAADLLHVRDGKVVRFAVYFDRDHALADIGLTESAKAQENVEVVRRAIAAVNARNLDGYLSCCTDTVELHTPLEPVTGAYSGPQDIKRFFADIEDAGPDFRIEVHRLEAIGPDRVLASVSVSSTGRSSGIPLAAETTNLYEFTKGKISRIRIFLDSREALKAVGLAD